MAERRIKRKGLRLHQKLSFALFYILLSLLIGASFFLYHLGSRLSAESDSLAALPVVDRVAQELEKLPGDLSATDILDIVSFVGDILPGAHLYLMTREGKILADLSLSADPDVAAVQEMKPVLRFVDSPFNRPIPSYAEDPGMVGHKNLFVASPVTIQGEQRILYAALEGMLRRRSTDAALDRYLAPYIEYTVGAVFVIAFLAVSAVFLLYTRRLNALMLILERYRLGDYSARALESGKDEVRDLAESVNRMAETIQNQVSDLEQRDSLRRELIANISHDLRGPVGVLALCAEQFSGEPVLQEDPELKERSKVLSRSTSSLSTLLTQLFELSKLETKETPADKIIFPINELMGELAARYQVLAAEKQISVSLNCPDEEIFVFGDPLLIERALANLIENALTYTLRGGSVKLIATPEANGTRLSIQDTGVGISPEDMQRIFERNFRVKKWSSQNATSGGLGLAIVNQIVKAHGSSIELQSVENEGSSFSFFLSNKSDGKGQD